MDAQEFWEDYQHLKKEASKLRTSEARLKQIRARYQAMLAGSTDPVLVIDRDGIIAEINPAACTAFDLDASDVTGEAADAIFSDEHAGELPDRAGNAIQSDSPIRFDWLLRRLHGPARQFSVRITPVQDETRRVVAAVCVARDISDLTALEEDLDRATEQLAVMLEDVRRLRDRVQDQLDQARR